MRVRGVAHAFAGRPVLAGVDLDVAAGERVAVVGPNGAGKSTLLRIMATLLTPREGTVAVGGTPYPDGVRAARRRIGYLGHDPLVYLDLTAWQNLRLFGDLYGVDGLDDAVPDALARVGLLPRAHDHVRTFSRGMAQRLGIARMLLHSPDVLLLDEPYTGLDAQGSRLLDGIVTGASSGTAVVMVTHDLARAHALCGRVVMIARGLLAWDAGTADVSHDQLAQRYAESAG